MIASTWLAKRSSIRAWDIGRATASASDSDGRLAEKPAQPIQRLAATEIAPTQAPSQSRFVDRILIARRRSCGGPLAESHLLLRQGSSFCPVSRHDEIRQAPLARPTTDPAAPAGFQKASDLV